MFAGYRKQVHRNSIREILLLGQLHWLQHIDAWVIAGRPEKSQPDREQVLVKFALKMAAEADTQSAKLLLSMVRTMGLKYPKTDNPAPLMIWDQWFELVYGTETLLSYQYRLPEETRALLKAEYSNSGLAVISTENNIRL